MRRKKNADQGVTLIAAGTRIIGDVHFKNELFVYGHVEGNLVGEDDKASVLISESGSVTGEVRVPNVTVNGRVEGDIFARVRVELVEKAAIHGNVYYRLIEMQLGARVEGQLVHAEDIGSAEDNVHPLPERKTNDE